MLKKKLFFSIISTFLLFMIAVGISFAWYTNKKVDDFESPDVTGYSTAAYYAGGDGSKATPFLIKNSRHLYNFAWLQYLGTYNKIVDGSVKQYYFEVIDDIDCEGLVLPPIGTIDNPFLGNFNGGNHVISNFTTSNNYNDLEKKPSSINSAVKYKGCEIIGFFGVIGKYADYVNVNINSQVNSVYDFVVDGVKINNACSNTLAGLIAGFVNGNLSNLGVHYGKINLKTSTSKLSAFDNISSYTLIGDYDQDLVSWEDKPNHSNGGAAQDFGGTIDFINMHKRMELIGANNWAFPTVSIDVPNESNNQILDSVITNRGYMPLVVSNDITQSYYSKNTEEKTLDSNIGYFVGSSAYLEKVNAIYEHNDISDSTDDVYGVIDEKFITRDASNKITDVQIYKAENKTNIEVTNTIDSGIKDTLVSMLNDGYLYGVRFTAQISNNQSVAIKNAIVDNGVVDSINVPNSSIWFKPLTSGTAKIVSYQANSTRSLSFYEITRSDNNSFSTSFLKEEMYMNGNEWNQTFYYFEVEVEAGHEYAIGSANGSDTAHFVYLDVGQNSGPPIVEDPELKESAIDDIDFVYLESGNSFSSTTVDYSNVFFQISGTTTSLIELFFRRNNDSDDNYAGSEGIVLFYPRSESGGEWVTTPSGKTSSGVSLDWSYAGTKGLSGTSDKYTDPTECEVLSGSKLTGGIENTNTGVNTKCTITYYYRKRNDDGSYESVQITKGTVTKGFAISTPTFEVPGYQIVKWYTDEAMTTEYDFSAAVEDNLVLYASVTEVETFNVTFVDGTEELQTVIVNSGSTAQITTPRKENYVFSHWVNEEGTRVDLETLAITSDIVLTAVWKDAYDIKFVYNVDGEDVIIDTVEIEQGDRVSMPDDDPKLSGYNFGGWYTSKEYTSEFNFVNAPTSDTTIYAKFVAIQYYDVTFGYIEDDELVTIIQNKVEEQTTVDEPIEPTRVGYVFGGWYADEACTIEFDFSSKITVNTTVYAKWQESLTVTFEYEDGTFIDTVSVLSGNKITATETSISKTGYRFDGNWYAKAANGSVSETPFDFDSAVEANMTLVPGWIKTYTVTFEYEDGTAAKVDVVDSGTEITLPSSVTTEYYIESIVSDDTSYNEGQTVTIEKDMTFTITKIDVYTVVVKYSEDNSETLYTNRDGLVTPTTLNPTNGNLVFDGWKYNGNDFDFSTKITTNMVIEAKWRYVASVTFNANGGTVATESTAVNEDTGKLATLPTPTKDNAIFDGWYTSDSYTEQVTTNTVFDTNTTIYAKWIDIYTITFDVNGGVGTYDSVKTDENGNITLPATDPTYEGHLFQGWYTGPDFVNSEQVTSSYKFTSDTTIYAGWRVAGKVSVTFDANGGTHTASETIVLVDEGATVTAIDSPTFGVNEFSHWSLTDGGEAFDFETVISSDITLYAVWSYKATITFNAGDGIVTPTSTTVDSSTGKLTSLPTPTRSGYLFVEWNTLEDGSGEKITTDMKFESNATVYAVWEEDLGDRYTITLDLGTGNIDGQSTIQLLTDRDGKITLPTPIAAEGKAFKEWRGDGWSLVTSDTVYTKDTTIYAQYSDTFTVTMYDYETKEIIGTCELYEGCKTPPEAPEKDGYKYVWVYSWGAEIDFAAGYGNWNKEIYLKYIPL